MVAKAADAGCIMKKRTGTEAGRLIAIVVASDAICRS